MLINFQLRTYVLSHPKCLFLAWHLFRYWLPSWMFLSCRFLSSLSPKLLMFILSSLFFSGKKPFSPFPAPFHSPESLISGSLSSTCSYHLRKWSEKELCPRIMSQIRLKKSCIIGYNIKSLYSISRIISGNIWKLLFQLQNTI